MKDFIAYTNYKLEIGRSEDLLGDSYWYVIYFDREDSLKCVSFFKKFDQLVSFLKTFYLESEV